MELYHTKLHTYARLQRYQGIITDSNVTGKLLNPSCGDAVSFTGMLENGTIAQIAFTGSGCVISQATASILSEFCIGKSADYILKLTESDITQLIEMDLGPLRIQCALLPLNALQQALRNYTAHQAETDARSA